ncbi:GDP-mannose 4,6-dehydratase [bacterium]|nr:GDP-mannose 4,6-dehydratase [bacterium]
MAKILVTGGCGFIGSHLVDKLIGKGHQVVVVDNLSTGKKENLNPKAKFYRIDIQDPKISQIFKKEKPETIFHFAAQIDVRKSVENPIGSARVDILGSLNLLENSKKQGVKKIIFASSGGAIYGETDIIPTPENHPEKPQSPYGVEKLAIEKYLNFYKKIHGLDYVTLRFANIYGPRQNSKGEGGVVAIFTDKLLHNQTPTIYGSGNQTRDFLFVEDTVDAALKSLAYGGLSSVNSLPIYNVGTGIETSVNELYKLLTEETGKDIKPKYAPAKKGEQLRSCLDSSKIKKSLNWQPKYSLVEGLRETISWFRKNQNS